MTCLLDGYKTKAVLKSMVAKGADPIIVDPSVFKPFCGPASVYMTKSAITQFPVCLDHPKRLKFAIIKLVDGKLKVE